MMDHLPRGDGSPYVSDLVADQLVELGIELIAINPGASFRGLHDSLVHRRAPEMILTLHENVAVGAAHGFAKSSGNPMAVALHNLVGLQSGSMAIFNAWADQVPMLILGGSGPADAATRRPWIDWVHTPREQALGAYGALKWHDEPRSPTALLGSLVRGYDHAVREPCGPTYVAIDVQLQEQELGDPLPLALRSEGRSIDARGVAPDVTARLATAVLEAERPVVLADRVGRRPDAYLALQRVADATGTPVVDLQGRHSFPTGHAADFSLHRELLLRDADLVVVLDSRDVLSSIGVSSAKDRIVRQLVPASARVVNIGLNPLMDTGFVDYASYPPHVEHVVLDAATFVVALAGELEARGTTLPPERARRLERLRAATTQERVATRSATGPITTAMLSEATHRAVRAGPWQIANGHLRGQVRRYWDLTDHNAHLGRNLGAGLGYGAAVAIGAALAHRRDDTLIVNLQSDGDLMYTPQAMWTAARCGLPILTVVVNNGTYGQDLMHQGVVAAARGRPASYASMGIDFGDPSIDYRSMAESMGVEGWGPVSDRDQLDAALAAAVHAVREERRPALVDVVVDGT